MSFSNTSPWVLLGASIIGAASAVAIYIVERMKDKKQEQVILKQNQAISLQHQEIQRLQKELEYLKQLSTPKNHSRSRRKHISASSVVSSSTIDDYTSAVDSSDLEFYDLSSDEEILSQENLEEVLKEIDEKLSDDTSTDAVDALASLEELSRKNPKDINILWRLAKAHKTLAVQATINEIKKNHIFKGIIIAEKAVEIEPSSAVCHKWLAILIGLRSEFVPIKEKLTDGFLFKKHLDIAVGITPNDPLLHHLLGRFAYEIAQLSWLEKTVAKTLFGEVPQLSYQDALEYFIKAENLSEKDWKANRLFLAKCFIAVGKKDDAVGWLDKAEESKSVEEDKIHEEVKNLLQTYKKR